MKKLIFDFDGTLVDSMKYWEKSMTAILDEKGISYPKDIVKIITPLGYEGSARYFINELGLDMPVDEIISVIDSNAIKAYSEEIVAKESVAECLEKWKSMGYSLNVLTASPHRTLDICLERNGISRFFDNIWSCDDFNTTKADVNIYYSVAEKLGTEVSHCIFFDDNFNALSTAKKAGMEVVGVYDESSAEYEDQIRALCPRYIYKFSEFDAAVI